MKCAKKTEKIVVAIASIVEHQAERKKHRNRLNTCEIGKTIACVGVAMISSIHSHTQECGFLSRPYRVTFFTLASKETRTPTRSGSVKLDIR